MTERTYDLSIDFKHFDVDLVNSNDLDGYCSMFSSFSLGLIRDFQEYADDPDADLGRDSTGFASSAEERQSARERRQHPRSEDNGSG